MTDDNQVAWDLHSKILDLLKDADERDALNALDFSVAAYLADRFPDCHRCKIQDLRQADAGDRACDPVSVRLAAYRRHRMDESLCVPIWFLNAGN
jgi:hypothetical protein